MRMLYRQVRGIRRTATDATLITKKYFRVNLDQQKRPNQRDNCLKHESLNGFYLSACLVNARWRHKPMQAYITCVQTEYISYLWILN